MQLGSVEAGLDGFPANGLGLLHLFAGLGYGWAVVAVLHTGVLGTLEAYEAWGLTPMHWAAARGHEVMASVFYLVFLFHVAHVFTLSSVNTKCTSC